MSDATLPVRAPRYLAACIVALILAVAGAASVSMARSMGYDESMHAELPAARMAVAVREGELGSAVETLLACQQYPFVAPATLAAVQVLTGVSEHAARASVRVLWALALLGIFLVAREVALGVARERALRTAAGPPGPAQLDALVRWAPWMAMGIAVLSPLGLAFSGTLFLEVPFTAVAVLATWAWLRRRPQSGTSLPARDLLAGAALAIAFFTKFNYGLLLAAGCAVDLAIEGIQAARQGGLRPWGISAARIALVPALLCLWWFVLPLPAGGDVAAAHRDALLGFLKGNQDLREIPGKERLLDWGAGVFVTPRALLVACIGAALALRFWRAREVRTIVILGVACCVPVAMHPFHMDRFLLPGAPYLWVLAALGLASVLPARLAPRLAVLAGVVLACGLRRDFDTVRLMDWGSPAAQPTPEIDAYRRTVLAQKISLDPRRILPTAGLERAESEALLDALAAEAGPEAPIGWLGGPDKLSVGALHIGLLARGGTKQRFLDNARDSSMFGAAAQDPGWDAARLRAFAAPFGVVFASEPPDLGGRAAWNFLRSYRERLVSEAGYAAKEFARARVGPREVALIALRPPP